MNINFTHLLGTLCCIRAIRGTTRLSEMMIYEFKFFQTLFQTPHTGRVVVDVGAVVVVEEGSVVLVVVSKVMVMVLLDSIAVAVNAEELCSSTDTLIKFVGG